jgi:hypothetical protein
MIWNVHYSNGDVPHATKDRGSFKWRDVLKLVYQFRGIASCKVGDGKTVLFWSDVWNENLLQQRFPRLFSFAKNQNISVAQFVQNNHMEAQFHLPLSEQTYQWIILHLQVDDSTKDT